MTVRPVHFFLPGQVPIQTAYAGICPHAGKQRVFVDFKAVRPTDYMNFCRLLSRCANVTPSCRGKETPSKTHSSSVAFTTA